MMVMTLPVREDAVLELALRMAEHLEQQGDVWPPAPVSPPTLRAMVADIKARLTHLARGERQYRNRRVRQQRGLAQVEDALREKLMGLDIEARGQPDRDREQGGGGGLGATEQEPPGAVRDLTAQRVGHTSVLLTWLSPEDGGEPSAYRVHRRKGLGLWKPVATVFHKDCFLSRQPWPAAFEVRVLAMNQAGVGPPSATVTVGV